MNATTDLCRLDHAIANLADARWDAWCSGDTARVERIERAYNRLYARIIALETGNYH